MCITTTRAEKHHLVKLELQETHICLTFSLTWYIQGNVCIHGNIASQAIGEGSHAGVVAGSGVCEHSDSHLARGGDKVGGVVQREQSFAVLVPLTCDPEYDTPGAQVELIGASSNGYLKLK